MHIRSVYITTFSTCTWDIVCLVSTLSRVLYIMAKRLRQSKLFNTFSKKHKESDSEEMSQRDIMEESDSQTVTTTSDIEAESAQNTG